LRQIAANLLFLKVFIIVLDSTFGEFYKEVRKYDFSTLELLIGQLAHMTKKMSRLIRALKQKNVRDLEQTPNPSKWVRFNARLRLVKIYLCTKLMRTGELLSSWLKSSNKQVKSGDERAEEDGLLYPREIGRMIRDFKTKRLTNLLKDPDRFKNLPCFRKTVLLDEKGRMEADERDENTFLKYYNGLISYVREKSKMTERGRSNNYQEANNSVLISYSQIFMMKKFLRAQGVKSLSPEVYVELLQEVLKEDLSKKKPKRSRTRAKTVTKANPKKAMDKMTLDFHNPLLDDNQVVSRKVRNEMIRMGKIDLIVVLAFREELLAKQTIEERNSGEQKLQAKVTEQYEPDSEEEMETPKEEDRIDQEKWSIISLLDAYKYFGESDFPLVREVWTAMPTEERVHFWGNEGTQICNHHFKFGVISAVGWTYKTDDTAVGTLRFARLKDLCYFSLILRQKNYDLKQTVKLFESETNQESEANESGSTEWNHHLKIKEEYENKMSTSEFFTEVIKKSGVMKILSRLKSVSQRYHAIMSKRLTHPRNTTVQSDGSHRPLVVLTYR
jgi:hypothetical protein